MVIMVVEDGTGLPLANSLCAVADADDILSTNPHSGWSDNTSPVKEGLLMWATRLICERARWKGTRVSTTSGLPFPRSGLIDQDRVYYPNDDVPQPVKIAVATLADFLGTYDPTQPNTSSNIKRLDVDVISLQYDLGVAPEKWPLSIPIILRDIAYINLGKSGGKRIVKH